MENKHFAKIDSWFFSHLRRVLGIKASNYSHIPNKEVWIQAGKPVIPSQMVLAAQFRLLLLSLNASPQEPMHHVAFSPGLKDRVSCYKNHKTGPPPPHWLSLVFGHPILNTNRMMREVYCSSMNNPIHNVVFCTGFKDRKYTQGRRRGMQFPYWVETTLKRYQPGLSDRTAITIGT